MLSLLSDSEVESLLAQGIAIDPFGTAMAAELVLRLGLVRTYGTSSMTSILILGSSSVSPNEVVSVVNYPFPDGNDCWRVFEHEWFDNLV